MVDAGIRPRFGLLTSGGDSSGMNAAIEALVRGSANTQWEPWGIREGFEGLLAGKVDRLAVSAVSGISGQAGTMLGSSRPKGLDRPERLNAIVDASKAAGLNSLVILGGDGSIGYVGARLQALGLPCVGIPCTIDNDVPLTEYTLGFESACQFALGSIDAMRLTGRAVRGRLFLVETLGGRTGHLALAVAEAAQADGVAIPEVQNDWAAIGRRLSEAVEQNGHALLVVSEGVTWAEDVEAALASHLPHRIRRTALGHAQRAGAPSHGDRLMGLRFAQAALALLVGGRTGHIVAWDGSAIVEVPLSRLTGAKRPVDLARYAWINGLNARQGKVE